MIACQNKKNVMIEQRLNLERCAHPW